MTFCKVLFSIFSSQELYSMKLILTVGLGSFLGGMLRYIISMAVSQGLSGKFPLGTLIVNIIGCFLIGVVFEWSTKVVLDKQMVLLLTTGILGGFTTFSAFSLETITMIREGHLVNATVYVLASVFIGLLATYAGVLAIKSY